MKSNKSFHFSLDNVFNSAHQSTESVPFKVFSHLLGILLLWTAAVFFTEDDPYDSAWAECIGNSS